MGAHLASAMVLVTSDLRRTGAPVPLVEESAWQILPGAEAAMVLSADRTGMGVWVDVGEPRATQIAMLADQVQEWVVELAMPRVTNWPACPEHPRNHPMAAVVDGDTAVWVCPTSGRRVSEIGHLAPPD